MALPNPWLTPLVTVPDAGAALGWSRDRAYRAAAAGVLPTVRLGVLMVRVVDLYTLAGLPLPPPGIPPARERPRPLIR